MLRFAKRGSNLAPTCKQPTPGKIPSANGIRLCTASLLLRLPRVREDSSTSDWSQFSVPVLHFARRGSNLLRLASNRRQGRSPQPMAFDCALASPLLRLPHVREDSSTSDRGLSSAIQCFIARDVDSNPASTCKQPTPGKIPLANGIRLCTASLLL